MVTVIRELELCSCCAIAMANADVSGCEDYHNHEPHVLKYLTGVGYAVTEELSDAGYNNRKCDACDEYGTQFEAVEYDS